jgi:molybdenum storage protein
LAPHGGLTFIKDHLQDLPMWLDGGMIPVCIGQPPYHFFEPPPMNGRLPENGTDVGLFLMAELIGAARIVYIKEVDGLYTNNPNTEPGAEFIRESIAADLITRNLPDLPFDRELLRCLNRSRVLKNIQLINGLKPDSLAKLFEGGSVGSTVHAGAKGDA